MKTVAVQRAALPTTHRRVSPKTRRALVVANVAEADRDVVAPRQVVRLYL